MLKTIGHLTLKNLIENQLNFQTHTRDGVLLLINPIMNKI